MTLGDRAGGMVLQVFPECHVLCIWLMALGSKAGAVMGTSSGPLTPSPPEPGMGVSCCR